jgi:hypothetical protein
MRIEDIIEILEERLVKLPTNELVNLWNKLFQEEKMNKEAIENNSLVKEEVSMMIIDELTTYGTKKLLSVYNKVTQEHITMEDIEREEEDEEEDFG